MTAFAQPPQPPRMQPLLFSELPESIDGKRRRRAGRRRVEEGDAAAAALVANEIAKQFVAPPPSPAEFEPAALSHAELRALLEALPDSKLAFLLLEAARDVKRRVVAPGDIDMESDAPPDPNPALLRAAAAAAAELSGEDDAPPTVLRQDRRSGKPRLNATR